MWMQMEIAWQTASGKNSVRIMNAEDKWSVMMWDSLPSIFHRRLSFKFTGCRRKFSFTVNGFPDHRKNADICRHSRKSFLPLAKSSKIWNVTGNTCYLAILSCVHWAEEVKNNFLPDWVESTFVWSCMTLKAPASQERENKLASGKTIPPKRLLCRSLSLYLRSVEKGYFVRIFFKLNTTRRIPLHLSRTTLLKPKAAKQSRRLCYHCHR